MIGKEASGVSGSILERLDDILTVIRLGLPGNLRRSLACTNITENMMSSNRRVTRNVKRWRNANMVLRFPAEAYCADSQDHFAHYSYAIPFSQTAAPAQVVCCGFMDGMPDGRHAREFPDRRTVSQRPGVMRAATAFKRLARLDMQWPFSSRVNLPSSVLQFCGMLADKCGSP